MTQKIGYECDYCKSVTLISDKNARLPAGWVILKPQPNSIAEYPSELQLCTNTCLAEVAIARCEMETDKPFRRRPKK